MIDYELDQKWSVLRLRVWQRTRPQRLWPWAILLVVGWNGFMYWLQIGRW